MNIIKAHAINNLCYKKAEKMKPAGIVVHSTGANNPNLKRYVDSPAVVGENTYGNHWNVACPGGRKVCVHAFIGYDKNQKVQVAEILPLNFCCWGVGSGKKGSYNYSPPYIQFEICEDNLHNKKYYQEAFSIAVQYAAHLCKEFKISVNNIVGHNEAHKKGYGSNHSDPEHWMKNFGDTMDDFRKAVSELLSIDNTVHNIQKDNTSTLFQDGDLVSITQDATYYNGSSIPTWVKKQNWYVLGNSSSSRIVIDKNESKTKSICSPINKKFLKLIKSASEKVSKNNSSNPHLPYLYKIKEGKVEIKKEPSTSSKTAGYITDKGTYTIVSEAADGNIRWGKLKSGAGWIQIN